MDPQTFRAQLRPCDAAAAPVAARRHLGGDVARIRRLTRAELPAEINEFLDVDDRLDIELATVSITGHRPQLAVALIEYRLALSKHGVLPPRLIELVRLRVAFHNQCRSCMAIRYSAAISDGLTEDLVCSLSEPSDAPDLTEAERAALRFADLCATDHLAIDDTIYAQLHRHFSEGEIVELGMNVALFVGFGRLSATWQLTEHLPADFHVTESIAPWQADHIVVR